MHIKYRARHSRDCGGAREERDLSMYHFSQYLYALNAQLPAELWSRWPYCQSNQRSYDWNWLLYPSLRLSFPYFDVRRLWAPCFPTFNNQELNANAKLYSYYAADSVRDSCDWVFEVDGDPSVRQNRAIINLLCDRLVEPAKGSNSFTNCLWRRPSHHVSELVSLYTVISPIYRCVAESRWTFLFFWLKKNWSVSLKRLEYSQL